jgi:hypothetical protein
LTEFVEHGRRVKVGAPRGARRTLKRSAGDGPARLSSGNGLSGRASRCRPVAGSPPTWSPDTRRPTPDQRERQVSLTRQVVGPVNQASAVLGWPFRHRRPPRDEWSLRSSGPGLILGRGWGSPAAAGGWGSDPRRSWSSYSYRAARVAAWRLRMRCTAAWLCTVLS